MAKQAADLPSVEAMLLRAREMAEELGEVVVVFFIDMAITETRMTNIPPAKGHKRRPSKQFRASETKKDPLTFDDSKLLDGRNAGLRLSTL